MEQIKVEEYEAFEVLQAAKVDEETLLKFSRDDLQDLFNGPEQFLLRRRLWTIIEKSQDIGDLELLSDASDNQSTKCSSTLDKTSSTQLPSSPDPIFIPLRSRLPSSSSLSSIPSTPTSSRSSSPILLTSPCTPGNQCTADDVDVVKSQPSPAFVVYCDSELSYAAKNDSMSDALFSRLMRSQLSNMRSELHRMPNPREPSNVELQDMAKALSRKYPCLKKVEVRGENGKKTFSSVSDDEIHNLTGYEKNNLHLFVFNRLKKRMYNSRPAKRPQGKVPSRGIKRLKKDVPEPVNVIDDQFPDQDESDDAVTALSQDISERHYRALQKEQQKKKPNKAVINQYLNLDFVQRRDFVEKTARSQRPAKLLEKYSCFKDATEVVEEVRRSLDQPEEAEESIYLRNCEKKLMDRLDPLIYYGISKGVMKPPRGQSSDAKVLHLMKNINSLFKSKSKPSKTKSKDKVDIINFVEEGDTVLTTWVQKKPADIPGLIMTKGNGSMLYIGKELLATFENDETVKAVICFLASFYLLDLDYPSTWLLSLSVLQKLIFEDKRVHPDCQADMVNALQEIEQYCYE